MQGTSLGRGWARSQSREHKKEVGLWEKRRKEVKEVENNLSIHIACTWLKYTENDAYGLCECGLAIHCLEMNGSHEG
jgi:hypothetical protein